MANGHSICQLSPEQANQATGFFGTWLTSVEKWGQDCASRFLCVVYLPCGQDVWTGLWANHAPGAGGLIEDAGSID